MRILMWDVHGDYTDSLVAGAHNYLFFRLMRQAAADSHGMAAHRQAAHAR